MGGMCREFYVMGGMWWEFYVMGVSGESFM